jgi:hypothetical protein
MSHVVVGLGSETAALPTTVCIMSIALFAVSTRLITRRTVDLCRVGSCLCRMH